MKKLAYLLVFIFASASIASCGGSSASCVSSDKYIIKNMKFENQEVVLSKEFKTSGEIMNWFQLKNIKLEKTIIIYNSLFFCENKK